MECTLTDEQLIEKCNAWVHKLAESGGNKWTLQVPVNFNEDPDILFTELGKRLKKRNEQLAESPSSPALDGWMPDEVVKYFKELFIGVAEIEGGIKKISQYGGSVFIHFNNKRTYKIAWGLYKSDVSLDD